MSRFSRFFSSRTELTPGDCSSVTKTFSLDDVQTFARISTDSNDIHLNEASAKAAGLQGVVVHGVLTMGLLSASIGTKVRRYNQNNKNIKLKELNS